MELTVPRDKLGSFAGLGTTGQILRVAEDSTLYWAPNHPDSSRGLWWIFENGGYGKDNRGSSFVDSSVGAGAARSALSGGVGWFQGAAEFGTGTTNVGTTNSQITSVLIIDADLGTITYEATIGIPVLSDGTDRFVIVSGFGSTAAGDQANGAYVRYVDNVNGGKFQFVTAKSAVRTSTDTGVTVGAGDRFHVKIVLSSTEAVCYLEKTYDAGGAAVWSDDGIFGSPVATNSTNLPLSTTTMCGIFKTVGTTDRKLQVGYQSANHTPPSTLVSTVQFASPGILRRGDGLGITIGEVSQCLGLNDNAGTEYGSAIRPGHPIIWVAYGKGNVAGSVSGDLGATGGGTGGTGSLTGTAVDNHLFGNISLNTSVATDGYVAWHTSKSLVVDAYADPMIVEGVFSVPTLSTAAQQHVFRIGLFDSVTAAPTDGVYLEIDSFVNGDAQFITKNGGTTTTTSSSLTIVAATFYIIRMIITSTSIDFYLKADGASGFGSPVATITTNIPTATLYMGARLLKVAGSTSRNTHVGYLLGFQRSTT